MPNWVQNRLTVKGKDADKILKQYLIEDKSEMSGYSFDFNKIKKMPESLKIVSGSITDNCLKVYLSSIPLNDYFDEAKLLVNAELFPTLTASGYTRLHENEVNELVQRCLDYGSDKPSTIEDPSFKTKDDVIAYGKLQWTMLGIMAQKIGMTGVLKTGVQNGMLAKHSLMKNFQLKLCSKLHGQMLKN